MRFETSQHLRLGQQMKLAPRMIQSMEILQLSALALEERIAEELEGNVALEMVEHAGDERALAEDRQDAARDATEGERTLVTDGGDGREDFERLDSMASEYRDDFDNRFGEDNAFSRDRRDDPSGEGDAKIDAMNNTAARSASLGDQLLEQWILLDTSPAVREAGKHLIGYIDDDGYIRTDLATIADQAPVGVSREVLDEALMLIRHELEPVGVGAADLRECLLLQLDQMERDDPDTNRSLERLLIEQYLPDIEANRLPKIALALNLPLEEVTAAIERFKSLDPRPGRRLTPDTPNVVIPDAIVEYDDERDEYIAMLFDGRLPRLRVNPEYAAMVKDKSVEKGTREFVDSSVRNARWLIEAIDLRNSTLLRVVRAVVAHQRDFFDQGAQALKPLPMMQVAEQLGVHVATVSRAVSGKWIQTPRGVLPLRRFFSSGTETESGDDLSWEAVRQMLKEVIDGEDKSNPLGDDKLAVALKERGINIARRTVAKYRDQLGIPPARLRKVF